MKSMLNDEQRAIVKAYGKAQMTLKSHAVVFYDFGEGDSGYLVLSCEELWTSHRCKQENHQLIDWMHPHMHPCWEDYGITKDDFSSYFEKRFPLLIPA